MRVEVAGARKRFGRIEALRGIDLDIPAGGRVALVGPNGSGKSTLIRALLGLVEVEGTVRLDGHSPYENRVAVARRLAYVPQVAPALGASVAEIVDLVGLTRALAPSRVAEAASRFELDLDQVARRPFRNLSGGMKQKLLLALAFAARPSLLVMDEPTASLDVRSRRRFHEACATLPPEVTLVLCSHRAEEFAPLVNRAVALADGQVVFDGPIVTYEALLAKEAES